MRHPRRNEVYRDVGSEAHEPRDPDFIDLHEIPFEPDAALLLCSDGLTDLIDSTMISDVAAHFAGRPHDVEGEQFAASGHRAEPRMDTDGRASGVEVARTESKSEATGTSGGGKRRGSRQIA